MDITEELVSGITKSYCCKLTQFLWFKYNIFTGMVKELTGSFKIEYHPDKNNQLDVQQVDFTPPFDRVRYSCMNTLLISDYMHTQFPLCGKDNT